MSSVEPTTDVERFRAAARDGRLLVQHCERCGRYQFPLAGRSAATGRCRSCGAPSPPWVAADGNAKVVSHTAVHGRPLSPGARPTIRVAGIVELTEGPWVHAELDADPSALRVGQAVRVRFTAEGEPPRPVFEPS